MSTRLSLSLAVSFGAMVIYHHDHLIGAFAFFATLSFTHAVTWAVKSLR